MAKKRISSKWGVRVDKNCLYCGQIFTCKPARAMIRKYCSPICVSNSQKKGEIKNCFNCHQKFYAPPSDGQTACSTLCARQAKKPKSFYRKIGLKGIESQKTLLGPTSIEKRVYEELKARGYLFETQKIIGGKFAVDAFIPSLNLVVECDGVYWHSLPEMKKRDKRKDAYLKKCGYELVRLGEVEIRNDSFKEKLNLWQKN